jgi:hypothetical protein
MLFPITKFKLRCFAYNTQSIASLAFKLSVGSCPSCSLITTPIITY